MSIRWSGFEWRTNERWGFIHPEKKKWWYDATAVKVDANHWLHLLTHKNPNSFPPINANPQIGAGLVSCTTKFKHGFFEIEAKLPRGKNLWPAFWMYSWDAMFPEIDVMEGYTRNSQDYSTWNPLRPQRVETNLFYSKNGRRGHIGGTTHGAIKGNPAESFVKYALHWKPDVIEFYMNGKSVRTIKDKNILKQCNATTMNVIINNGVDDDVKGVTESDFVVKYFKYER